MIYSKGNIREDAKLEDFGVENSAPIKRGTHLILFDPINKAIFMHISKSGDYTLPGGSMEPTDTSTFDTLVREGIEEKWYNMIHIDLDTCKCFDMLKEVKVLNRDVHNAYRDGGDLDAALSTVDTYENWIIRIYMKEVRMFTISANYQGRAHPDDGCWVNGFFGFKSLKLDHEALLTSSLLWYKIGQGYFCKTFVVGEFRPTRLDGNKFMLADTDDIRKITCKECGCAGYVNLGVSHALNDLPPTMPFFGTPDDDVCLKCRSGYISSYDEYRYHDDEDWNGN